MARTHSACQDGSRAEGVPALEAAGEDLQGRRVVSVAVHAQQRAQRRVAHQGSLRSMESRTLLKAPGHAHLHEHCGHRPAVMSCLKDTHGAGLKHPGA